MHCPHSPSCHVAGRYYRARHAAGSTGKQSVSISNSSADSDILIVLECLVSFQTAVLSPSLVRSALPLAPAGRCHLLIPPFSPSFLRLFDYRQR